MYRTYIAQNARSVYAGLTLFQLYFGLQTKDIMLSPRQLMLLALAQALGRRRGRRRIIGRVRRAILVYFQEKPDHLR